MRPYYQDEWVTVKISAKSMRQLFRGCTIEYIHNVCKGRCCEGINGISVAIHPLEQERIESLGGIVKNSLLQVDARGLCPFKADDGLCNLHGTPDKPLGCIASPFTLNANGTLIIRNRYRLLRCYRGGIIPAYRVFRASLDALFGNETQAILNHLDNGGNDIYAPMLLSSYQKITYNTAIRSNNG